jgi:hypothetical protein
LYRQRGTVQTAWYCTDSVVLYRQRGIVQTDVLFPPPGKAVTT